MSDEQTSSHRNPSRVLRCLILSLSFVIVVPLLCITLALKLGPGGELLYDANSDSMAINRTIYLSTDLVSVDIPKATMVMDWFVSDDSCKDNCTDVGIFFDTAFLRNLSSPDHRDDHTPYSTDIPTDPIFRWNASFADLRQNSDVFRTGLVVDNDGSMVYYPFDSYWASVHAFARDTVTNESVSLSIATADGLMAGLKTTVVIIEEDPSRGIDIVIANLSFQRSALVIGYCVTITLTFWLVTLMICLIVMKTMVFGLGQRNEIVLIPIGIMFVFTLLRFSMPGAPDGFGDVLDFAGLLPCFVLLSISTVIMLGINLFGGPHNPAHEPFIWKDIGNMLRHYIRKPSYDSNLAHQTSGVL